MRRFLVFCVIVVMIPYVATLALSGTINGIQEKNFAENNLNSNRKIYLDRKNRSYVDVEEYLVGAVAKQMPADYELEALKAQAIIARTFVYRQMEGREEIPETELSLEYLEEEQMEKLWGKPRFLEYYQKVREAVEATKGKTILFEGDYIEPLFHRASAGKTRDGDKAHPYLLSVEAEEDVEAEGYLTVITWTVEQFIELIQKMPGGEHVNAEQIPDSIQLIARDKAGYVTEIQIGSHSFDGEEVRTCLGLPSAAYTLEGYEEGVRAVCRGQGHGYGMSQYGAHKKATQGMRAEEILTYYYQNIEIISEEQ